MLGNLLSFQDLQKPGDKLSRQPDWRPFYLLAIYRLLLGLIFSIFASIGILPGYPLEADPELFIVSSWIYLFYAVLALAAIYQRWLRFHPQIVIQTLLDIVLVTLMMHVGGGVDSGLGMLLIVAIAGGSLLSHGRTAFFFAAIASLCVLVQVGLENIYSPWFSIRSYTHASMLGITFFATALLAYSLARRVYISEALAAQRGIHVQYLAHLNEQIVQHIQSGIVVVDNQTYIRLFNETARRLLNVDDRITMDDLSLHSVDTNLSQLLLRWYNGPGNSIVTFHPDRSELELLATFTALPRGGRTSSVLILLEDATLTKQHAQQLKLASLGRLTASIAHEIRNPLAAISHAAQLLGESSTLDGAEQRMTQIIYNQSKRVNNIVESVLQLSRRGQSQLQHFNLNDWLRHFTEELIAEKCLSPEDIVLEHHHDNLLICFDPEQLYQVLGNLCENGLRYSHFAPRLQLTVSISDDFGRPCLDVQDHGPGITDAIAMHIFEPFFTTEAKGSGLGLYLARELCEANQALLHMIEHDKNGCCFRILFSTITASTSPVSDSQQHNTDNTSAQEKRP